MRNKYFFLIILVVFFAVYVAGTFTSSQCSTIGSCQSCWKTYSIEVSGSLCRSNTTCIAKPYVQQHNAVVDSLTCACSAAKSSDYANAALNKQIEDAFKAFKGYSSTASDLCESNLLTKVTYDPKV